jgi:plastocyanin
MRILIALLATGCLALAACGGSGGSSSSGSSSGSSGSSSSSSSSGSSGSSSSGGGGSDLKLDADPSGQLKFTVSSLSAKAGKVTLTMDNPSDVPHAIAVEGNGVDQDGKVVNKDGTSTVTANLKAGKYTFYCPVDGHRAAGMQGTLTVK